MATETTYPPSSQSSIEAAKAGAHADVPAPPVRSKLEEYERDDDHKPPYYLGRAEVKLLGIAGVCSITP
jgi:hypothetical protein